MTPYILILGLAVVSILGFCVTHSLAWHQYQIRRARKQESHLWSKAV